MEKTWKFRNKREGVEVVVTHAGRMEYTVDVTDFGRWKTRRQLGEACADANQIMFLTRAQVAESFAYSK